MRSVCKRVNLPSAQGAEVVINAGTTKNFHGHSCTETAENQPRPRALGSAGMRNSKAPKFQLSVRKPGNSSIDSAFAD